LGKQLDEEFSIGKAQIINKGKDIVILALGNMVEKAIGAISSLKKENINPTLVNVRFVKPIDEETILDVTSRAKLIIIIEESACIGGLGDAILEIIYRNNMDNKIIKHIALPDRFIRHGKTEDLRKECNMTEEHIYNIITNWYKEFP
jgi:1-deoxy-D-xylulose-5-phosphate synthase